ncbi:di-heme-cytochrome C peroxidase [Beggiatoa leptomitoformis]|uniref:Cytochrome c domain-containing protein n=1 Tax=Beggiatoa leptomitoformis TaxID=288004 RepID=A0A2N9YGT8_9GAMM|nr:di-heme-cytochrome C peroxidase [Beggiatoa leptomitoformis]AUI69683.1 hypothetical protein BLE401_13965 [Beggiatoa leptomitoformis]QGX03692.1 hypothetical protein AL038_10315 [Beggiatoa leptomitoformis]
MRLSCRRLLLFLLLIALVIGFYWAKSWYESEVGVPAYQAVDKIVSLEQGWSAENIDWYHYSTQGSTFFLKDSWFLALEQPVPSLFFSAAPFRDKAYLGSYGFLFDPEKTPYNKEGLPIGFTIDNNFVDPLTQEKMRVVGLSCAACHTGQLNYKGTGVRIEGGQSMANFSKFQNALGFAMLLNYYDPFRFDRFAKNVLGADYSKENKTKLKEEFYVRLQSILKQGKLDKQYASTTIEGFGRLDALNRIGNFVFGFELYEGNYRTVDAPVTFPFLWGISWFDWVQYNGSVMQPMTRNAGEALGVFAPINLKDAKQGFFQSTLAVENLYQFEKLIGGEKPFEGLKAPVWPENVFGAIDQTKASKGATLYREKCMSCHLPPVTSDEICQAKYWTAPNKWGLRFLKLTMVNVDLLGTDSQVVTDWAQRFVETKQLGLGVVKAEQGLPLTVENAVNIKYQALGLTQAQQDEYNGKRENKVRSPLCYKARPLEGVWATPPFLHNGSVPNLYQLLSPVAERAKTFYLSSQEFDPQSIGYNTDYVAKGFQLDTTLVGNHNTGHEFRSLSKEEQQGWNGQYPYNGVLGAELTEQERWELIEYLKTLKSRDLNQQTAACPTPIDDTVVVNSYANTGVVDTCQ